MALHIDLSKMDLREAYDFAILIEEEAQHRYQQLASAFEGDPSGVGDVLRVMAANERKHRDELEARRYSMFREDAQPLDISVAEESVERPEPGARPATPRDALLVAYASETRAYDYYREALEHVVDSGVRALFEDLMEEEAEHQELIAHHLAKLARTPVSAATL